MSVTLAIARRELGAVLCSPVGYLVPALFLFFTALVYFGFAPLLYAGFSQGQPASLNLFFEVGVWVFFLIGPAISMRLLSDEFRLGTFEALMTAPVTEAQVVLGKFLGSLGFLVLMLVPTAVYVVALEVHGRPDYGEVAAGYLGLLLIGSAYLASGLVASSLTSSQVLAYLSTIFFWLIYLLLTMGLPAFAHLAGQVSARDGGGLLDALLGALGAAARFLSAGNPVVRVRGFVNGLVDSMSVVYFVLLTAFFLVAAVKSLAARRWSTRALPLVDLGVFLAALVTIVVVVDHLAYRPELRVRFDATRTRAYSLSPQTEKLLAGLSGQWTIALIMVEESADAATRQQVAEVLRRYERASDFIRLVRIDPSDPRQLVAYETLLAQARELEAESIAAYDRALDEGTSEYRELILFAQGHSAQLSRLIEALPAVDPSRGAIEERLAPLSLVAREGEKVLDAVMSARRESPEQPIADYETARSILGGALAQGGDELLAMALAAAELVEGATTSPDVVQWASAMESDYRALAARLSGAADPLLTLAPLEIAAVGRQLRQGEALIVLSPGAEARTNTRGGVAVVPSAQLFPSVVQRDLGEGRVAIDRRFRGEQVISAAIRSLLVDQMPLVVFVHAEPKSILSPTAQGGDLAGMTEALGASRFVVREWSVGKTTRPVPRPGQSAVWVIVPPTSRQGLEPQESELLLVRATESLIDEGEPVLLNVNPSLLPRYRRPDPWQRASSAFGLRPVTGEVVFGTDLAGDEEVYRFHQRLRQYGEHPIGLAAFGLDASFPLPVPIEPIAAADAPSPVTHTVVAEVAADGIVWRESAWRERMIATSGPVERGEPITAAQPIVVAAVRSVTGGSGEQRFVIAGSGGWMMSYVADSTSAIGGRTALDNPGNAELFLASIAWLGGLDELIAPSPLSRQVARLDGLDARASTLWGLVAIVGVPLACLAIGALVGFVRRG